MKSLGEYPENRRVDKVRRENQISGFTYVEALKMEKIMTTEKQIDGSSHAWDGAPASMPGTPMGNVPIGKKIKFALLFVLVAVTGITCIHVPEWMKWRDLVLQHIGTLLLVIPLLYDTRKNRMPLFAFVGVTLFAILHVVGARYGYSHVPYREWSVNYLGVSADYWGVPANYLGDLTAFFDAHYMEEDFRNHYDRLVHISFGFLMFPYLLYISREWVDRKTLTAIFVAWLLVQTGSMVYEIFEWQLAVLFSPETADRYNGQQGDVWDAQKDMLLAMIGSTIMAIFYVIKSKYENRCR